jgi:microcystin degradation protein MlrC
VSIRVAVGGITHETNTYADGCFGQTEVGDFTIDRAEEIVRRYEGTRTFVGGMLQGAEDIGAVVVPTFTAIAQPSGTISRAAYETMKAELLERLRDALPVDAVALELHGAGVVDGIDDLEGDLAGEVRALVGDAVPIVAPLDLHGNITDRMAEVIDLMLGVHYYPHTDMYERGREAVNAIPRLLDGSLRPTTHVEHLPMLTPSSCTDFGPAKATNELCWQLEDEDGVVDVTFFHGFPFTDTPDAGAHIVVTTDGDPDLARRLGKQVASFVWEHREAFRPETDTPELAVRRAMPVETGPVVINETSDNSGGGAPADSTHLLRALLEAKVTDAVFGFLCDPEVAAAAHRAGVGATIDVHLGGKHDDIHGAPIPLTVYVKSLSDGRFTYTTPMFEGVRANYGKMARLQVAGMDILVGSERSQTFDTEVFLLNGIDVTRYKIVALKSSQHFRAGFGAIATEIITSDAPGLTTERVEAFERTRPAGPLWPKDPSATYTP